MDSGDSVQTQSYDYRSNTCIATAKDFNSDAHSDSNTLAQLTILCFFWNDKLIQRRHDSSLKRITAIPLLDFGETKDKCRLLFLFLFCYKSKVVLLMKPLFKHGTQSFEVLQNKPCSKRFVHLRWSVLCIYCAKHSGFSRNNPKQKAIPQIGLRHNYII